MEFDFFTIDVSFTIFFKNEFFLVLDPPFHLQIMLSKVLSNMVSVIKLDLFAFVFFALETPKAVLVATFGKSIPPILLKQLGLLSSLPFQLVQLADLLADDFEFSSIILIAVDISTESFGLLQQICPIQLPLLLLDNLVLFTFVLSFVLSYTILYAF